MVLYRLKLGDHVMNISVPKDIRGLHHVADYICRFEAKRFALKVTPKSPLLTRSKRKKANEDNWYDSHIDAITELVTDLRDKLRAKYA